jgi:tRNA1(Val) A37 N6-methylase TrmN6
VLDIGCGVGAAMLCLATRVLGITLTGVDIQPELVELCRRNITLNEFQDRITVAEGDATSLGFTDFDQVMINPPYHNELRHDFSLNAGKRLANTEKDGDLPLWIAAAARALKDGGVFTLIQRADRMEEILNYATVVFGEIKILPVVTKPGTPAKRVIMQCRKIGQPSVTTCKNLILNNPEGGYSDEAENILRHANSIDFIDQNA